MQSQRKSKASTVKVYGEIGSQKAPGRNGAEVAYGPSYNRTLSMKALKVRPSTKELPALFRKELVQEGGLICSLHEDEGCIRPRTEFGSTFTATLLEKVKVNDDTNKAKKEFYPVLHRLLTERRNWGSSFVFNGLSTFMVFLMEWTKHIVDTYRHSLEMAGIYGLAALSQFPYHYRKDVWRAFCEHWSPLTNTLHHGAGELGISLMDLQQIGGLPILGEPYEEYLPRNDQLLDDTLYPSTVVELLTIHAKLCRHHNTTEISWHRWLQHFYRGKQEFYAYGEDPSSSRTRKSPSPAFRDNIRDSSPRAVSHEGELAAFVALLLSRFALPMKSKTIRPETFVMAGFMAQGRRVSIAPTVLGHIYHELGTIATHPGNPGDAEPSFGLHFVVGWLAEYFPSLYPSRPDEEFEENFPSLAKYTGILGHPLDLYQARLIFRGTEKVSYRAVNFGSGIGSSDRVDIDTGDLSDQLFEHLVTIRSGILPVRFGTNLLLQPYYPNRFARQFGFDQAVPNNSLRLSIAQRSRRSLEDIAMAYARLFRKDTQTLFQIPPSFHLGTYTSHYCRWWARISAPYLTQSAHNIRSMLTGNSKCIEREPNFVISDSRIITRGIRGKVKVSEWHSHGVDPHYSAESSAHVRDGVSVGTRKVDDVEGSSDEESLSADVNFKRIRYSQPAGFDQFTPIGTFPSIVDEVPMADNPSVVEDILPDEATSTALFAETVTHTNLEQPVAQQPQEKPLAPEANKSVAAILPERAPTDLSTLLPLTMNKWTRNSLVSGITHIVDVLSSSESAQELLAKKPDILQILEGLQALVGIVDVNLAWFFSRVQDLLDNVGVVTKIAGDVDTQCIEHLSGKLAEFSTELASRKTQLAHLDAQWSTDLQKEEKELLALKEQVRKKELQLESNKAKQTADGSALRDLILQDEHKIQVLAGEMHQFNV